MNIVDAMLKVVDDNGNEIVFNKDQIFTSEVKADVVEFEYRVGGPFAVDGRTRVHRIWAGVDWTFTLQFAYHQAMPLKETVSEYE